MDKAIDHKALVTACASFREISTLQTLKHVLPTYLLIILCMIVLAVHQHVVMLPISVLLGLLLVRSFIVFHDTMHNAIFRTSPVARAVVMMASILTVFSPSVWRHRHNAHHKHNTRLNDLITEGQFPILSVNIFNKLKPIHQRQYLRSRNPVLFVLAYPRFFIYESLKTWRREPKSFWTAPLWLALHLLLMIVLGLYGGLGAVVLVMIIPLLVSSMIGAYLFYVQHNFEGMVLTSFDQWNHLDAALHSSSMLNLSPVMHWFTGNIGYHHIHHLNAMIPFYRLPEVYNAIPELQTELKIDLNWRTIRESFSLVLWDEDTSSMISVQESHPRVVSV